MRILIIDDDSEGVEYIATFLQLEGVTVDSTARGSDGLELVQQLRPDVVLLDVLLPDIDGWELCRQIRAFSDIPILMFTAYAREPECEIKGLDCGADDYLVKPIDYDVVKARIEAVLRRYVASNPHKRHLYLDPRLIIDLDFEEIFVEGKRTPLSHLEYHLLELLVRNLGQVITTLEIIEELWGENDSEKDYPDRVHTYIRRLRKKIESDPSAPYYLVTEYGFGYRFVPHP